MRKLSTQKRTAILHSLCEGSSIASTCRMTGAAANHAYAVALHAFFYNFARPHMTLTKKAPKKRPTTPAMACGLTDRVWTVADLVAMLEGEEARLEHGGRINRASRS